MIRVYATWVNGIERLVKANSKKDVRKSLGVDIVDFYCNITKKNEKVLASLPICDGSVYKTYYCVATTIPDRGKSVISLVNTMLSKEKPSNSFKSTSRADYYLDWFDTEEEAKDFIDKNS